MPKLNTQTDDDDSNVIPQYPEQCNCRTCPYPDDDKQKETAVSILRAHDPTGKHRCVQASEAVNYKNDGTWNAKMKRGWEFRGWIARCAWCYTEDQSRGNAS